MLTRTSSYITIKRAAEAYFIPERMIGGFYRYLVGGIKPGDFWYQMLSGEYRNACYRADNENLALIGQYHRFLEDQVTPHCFGSTATVEEWINSFLMGADRTDETI